MVALPGIPAPGASARSPLARTKRLSPILAGAAASSAAGPSLESLEEALLRGDRVAAGEARIRLPGSSHARGLRETGVRDATQLVQRTIDDALASSLARDADDGAPTATSLYFATALGDCERVEAALEAGEEETALAFDPFARSILSTRSDWRRGGIFSTTCVSAIAALEQASADLELGRTDRAVVVAFDALSRTMHAGFSALRALSPSGTCRPFDRCHDGIVLGESVCALVFETGSNRPIREAPSRSVRVRASRLISDSLHLTTPDPEGRAMAEAIRGALADASLEPEELGGVLFTAIGSPLYDAMLERALVNALGPEIASRLPVSSWETATGHALAATGALAIAFAARAVTSGRFLPLAGIEERDPGCEMDLVTRAPRPLARQQVLALVVGFGGQNAALIVGTEVR